MAMEMLVNIGSGYSLLVDETKPLSELTTDEALWHSFQGNIYMNTQDISPQSFLNIWDHNHIAKRTMN